MTRGFDFVVATVISIISIVIHRISVALFAPEGTLYGIATDGTAVMNGAERAELWSQILIVWAPFLVFCTIWIWVLIREYRRRAVTTARPVR